MALIKGIEPLLSESKSDVLTIILNECNEEVGTGVEWEQELTSYRPEVRSSEDGGEGEATIVTEVVVMGYGCSR